MAIALALESEKWRFMRVGKVFTWVEKGSKRSINTSLCVNSGETKDVLYIYDKNTCVATLKHTCAYVCVH